MLRLERQLVTNKVLISKIIVLRKSPKIIKCISEEQKAQQWFDIEKNINFLCLQYQDWNKYHPRESILLP